jgi:hypothetical protein
MELYNGITLFHSPCDIKSRGTLIQWLPERGMLGLLELRVNQPDAARN